MAQVQVYNQEGKKTSKLELADSVFGIEPNKALETEGYRQSSSGFNKKSTVDTRRYRSWS